MTTEQRMGKRDAALLASAIAWACASIGCSEAEKVATSEGTLVAVCTEADAGLPSESWLCPASRTVECDQGDGTAVVDWIYVVPPSDGGGSCSGRDLSVDDEGPFAVGVHPISVSEAGPDGGETFVCTAELNVVDTEPPVAEVKRIVLWPPDHRMHTITPDDCVSVEDRCEGVLHARFVGVACDEPVDGRGDGHTDPDVVEHPDSVELRAERSGSGHGRHYTLRYEAEDSAGNRIEGACIVEVPHDASDGATRDGDAGCGDDQGAPDAGP